MKNQQKSEIVYHKEFALNENNYMTLSIMKIDDVLYENKTIVRFKYDYNGKFLGRETDSFINGKFIDRIYSAA